MNRLKLKLLRASLVIAELVREKEKLASIVRSLVSHLGADNSHLQQSMPQCPDPHTHHTKHQDNAPHPTNRVIGEESELERSESSSKPPPGGRMSSSRQERGVQFEEPPPPLGEGGGSRTQEEVPAVGGGVCQDVRSEDLREECPGGCCHWMISMIHSGLHSVDTYSNAKYSVRVCVYMCVRVCVRVYACVQVHYVTVTGDSALHPCSVPTGQPRVVSEVGSGGDLDLSVSLSTLQFEDSLKLSRDREEFQSLMNDILTPRT